jgi:hypothetical protein
MDQQSEDRQAARRLPGAGGPFPGTGPAQARPGRASGLVQVRRWSNLTAAALIAGTALTTGYLARASVQAAAPAAATSVAGAAAGTHQPCISVPVATSGGSGVTRQTVVRSCGTAGPDAPVVAGTSQQTGREDS